MPENKFWSWRFQRLRDSGCWFTAVELGLRSSEARMCHRLSPGPWEGLGVLASEESTMSTFRSCLKCWSAVCKRGQVLLVRGWRLIGLEPGCLELDWLVAGCRCLMIKLALVPSDWSSCSFIDIQAQNLPFAPKNCICLLILPHPLAHIHKHTPGPGLSLPLRMPSKLEVSRISHLGLCSSRALRPAS